MCYDINLQLCPSALSISENSADVYASHDLFTYYTEIKAAGYKTASKKMQIVAFNTPKHMSQKCSRVPQVI